MEFEIIKKERIFNEFFEIDRVSLKLEKYNDHQWSEVRRYNIQRPEAVAVLLLNKSNNKIVLVEQFRYATLKSTKSNGWAREIVAGLIDRGETPEECAMRETMEETGYQIEKVKAITTYFASIGITDELIHLFYATVTNDKKIEAGGGLEDENEDLKIIELGLPEVMDSIKRGDIRDAKTIIAAQWLALQEKEGN